MIGQCGDDSLTCSYSCLIRVLFIVPCVCMRRVCVRRTEQDEAFGLAAGSVLDEEFVSEREDGQLEYILNVHKQMEALVA